MSQITIKNKGLAAYVLMKLGVEPVVNAYGFQFDTEISEGEWEREYMLSEFSVFNGLIVSLSRQQRSMTNHNFDKTKG